jgi:putative pyruvate formate lyase activating enzyme
MAILKDEKTRVCLARYFCVMQDEKPAKFMISKKLPAEFSQSSTTEELWDKHRRLAEEYNSIEREIDDKRKQLQEMPIPEKSFLDLKIEISSRILHRCHLCVRRCEVDRFEEKRGYCGCGSNIVVSSIFEHLGEEPELVPSGTIFTMGCTMRCKHCQNYTISQWFENGETYKTSDLAGEVERLRINGCRNANLVGGEPTPWLQQWLETFKQVDVNVPIVWNSNSYYSPETAQLLRGFIDVYLLDFKYGPGICAERISEAANYWNVCTHNHLEAVKHGELIVRILVMPNHLECCANPIMKWIAANLGRDTRVNVMFQYRPEWRAHDLPELHRALTGSEIELAVRLAKDAQLTNVMA